MNNVGTLLTDSESVDKFSITYQQHRNITHRF